MYLSKNIKIITISKKSHKIFKTPTNAKAEKSIKSLNFRFDLKISPPTYSFLNFKLH